ncbi:hypothetical protein HanRHA438_Chr03g0119621 [Helianthus annuus]|nr:hypothetical protein HanRHA438_Chr03g0119621 [Helianthus annuus]
MIRYLNSFSTQHAILILDINIPPLQCNFSRKPIKKRLPHKYIAFRRKPFAPFKTEWVLLITLPSQPILGPSHCEGIVFIIIPQPFVSSTRERHSDQPCFQLVPMIGLSF